MTETQYVTIEGDSYEYLCEPIEYPFNVDGVRYTRLIVVDQRSRRTHIMIVEQSRVIKRIVRYSDKQLVTATEATAQYEMQRMKI